MHYMKLHEIALRDPLTPVSRTDPGSRARGEPAAWDGTTALGVSQTASGTKNVPFPALRTQALPIAASFWD